MVEILRRGLFWRIYLTLLASLLAVALLAAAVSHWIGEGPMGGPRNPLGGALGALMPAADAPPAQTRAALDKISASLNAPVALLDADGRIVMAALNGKAPPPWMSRRTDRGVRHVMGPAWPAHLPDGRLLLIGGPERIRGGPHILGMLMMVAAAVGLAAFPIVSLLTRRLELLRASVDAWGAGRLDARAAVVGHDEIAAVAASFNAAADRVEALLAAHKALLAHASHELRSPLARLRMAVDLYAVGPDPALRPAIIADITELDGLVDEILLASQLDHGPELPERESVDLLGLAAEEAARSGVALRHTEGELFEVEGSTRWLRRMIRNLLDNACKHGLPPVELELRRTRGPDALITIAVHDSGPGIPDDERERVFEPFYRPLGRAEAAGSWGLGLSIVHQIAQRHGGRASCAGGPNGSDFVIELPAPTSVG
jgi:signal transduction histidine kinase